MYLVVLAIFAFSSIAVADETLLEPAKPIVRELSGGQENTYRISHWRTTSTRALSLKNAV